MILTVTPNPAVDVTYVVGDLRRGESHRVTSVSRRPGGKGINVARVLHALGEQVAVLAPLGGPSGDYVADALAAEGITVLDVPIDGETRQTVTVVDGEATVLNEPGPPMTEAEYAALLAAVEAALPHASVLVVSGSSPAGAPEDLQARMVSAARVAGVPVIVDASGPALLRAVEEGPSAIKPNAEELLEATGSDDVLGAARLLAGRGVGCVVASLGHEGLLAVTTGDCWRVDPVPGVSGNPTGAGDAAVAGLARALAAGHGWDAAITEAGALGAAAVLSEVAGEVDLAAYRRFLLGLHAVRID